MKSNSAGGRPDHMKAGSGGSNKQLGIFLGKVKDNVDPEGLGRIRVWIAQLGSASEADESSWFTMRYCPPFAGAQAEKKESRSTSATSLPETNQSYGFWAVPPDKDVYVICGFINGESHQGIWWACLPHDGHTHSLPGIASGSTHKGEIKVVSERNRYNSTDPQKQNRPKHFQQEVLARQGLEKDLRRGHTNAGPFRDKDKHPGHAYGFVSPAQHSLLIDDGPNGKTGGQIRLRTRSGNTILMNNDEGFIYMINANGSAWFQMDSAGNVDFYCQGDFSVHTEGSVNFRADNNINFEAEKGINMKSGDDTRMESTDGKMQLTGNQDVNITSEKNVNIFADSQIKETAQRIDLNGPPADRADCPGTNSLITNAKIGKSVASRVPEAEPYGGHTALNGGEAISVPAGVVDETLGNHQITPADIEGDTPGQPNGDPAVPPLTNAEDCVPEVTQSTLSEEGFKLMKSREAYRGMMYSDFQGYSVGYGTRIDIFGPDNPNSKIDANLKKALLAGPSEAEARLASRQIVDRHMAPSVIAALEKAKKEAGRQVCITQAQIDALIMAAYGSPVVARQMAEALVKDAAASPDGKATKQGIAKIWANAGYSNSASQRSSEANYAIYGKPNADARNMTQDQLREKGLASDEAAIKTNKARNPQTPWTRSLGNGPTGGERVDAAYGPPTPTQAAQWERSAYLNTGKVPHGVNLTLQQLKDKYGPPHIGGNYPPGTPAPPTQA
jgi:GH24 family phage-related lysozyme (muramidase)